MFETFDFATYRQLLLRLSRDRPCVGFPRALELGADPYCIVRHDIDFSLTAALRMAEVEAELGITATYFLLFSGSHYNLLGDDNSRVPRALTDLGHEVGLHYDARVLGETGGDQALELLRREADLLATLSGAPVRVIARHNPGLGGADPVDGVTDFLSAYDPRFTSRIAYVSDSCGAWREDALAVITAERPPANLQLLIHPLFWDEPPADRWTHLARLRQAQLKEIEAHTALAQDLWSRHPGVLEHDRRVGAVPSQV